MKKNLGGGGILGSAPTLIPSDLPPFFFFLSFLSLLAGVCLGAFFFLAGLLLPAASLLAVSPPCGSGGGRAAPNSPLDLCFSVRTSGRASLSSAIHSAWIWLYYKRVLINCNISLTSKLTTFIISELKR